MRLVTNDYTISGENLYTSDKSRFYLSLSGMKPLTLQMANHESYISLHKIDNNEKENRQKYRKD